MNSHNFAIEESYCFISTPISDRDDFNEEMSDECFCISVSRSFVLFDISPIYVLRDPTSLSMLSSCDILLLTELKAMRIDFISE